MVENCLTGCGGHEHDFFTGICVNCGREENEVHDFVLVDSVTVDMVSGVSTVTENTLKCSRCGEETYDVSFARCSK